MVGRLWHLAGLVLLFMVIGSSLALTHREQIALNALLDTFPYLGTWGWSQNTSTACSGTWSGLTCLDDHVSHLTITPPKGVSGTLPNEVSYLAGLLGLTLGHGFVGTLPPSMSSLSYLKHITIDLNGIHGPLPDFSRNTMLHDLALTQARFITTIPDWIWTFRMLMSLTLSGSFQGPIDSIGNLEQLQLLSIEGSDITGPLPESIGTLSRLARLSATSSKLAGPLPWSIGRLRSLTTLKLSHNRLTGTIPSSIGHCGNLAQLYLESNHLSGTLPPELNNMSLMTALWVSHNQLEGALPPLNRLRALEILDFSDNHFSSFPSEPMLGELNTAIHAIDLSSNKISGSLPSYFFNLPTLQTLAAKSNLLIGSLPSVGAPTGLALLDLSFNQLSGSVPLFLNTVSNLNLKSNLFSGSLFGFQRIEKLDVSFNLLTSFGNLFRASSGIMSIANLESNRMGGSIFNEDQFTSWEVLILSNNSLSGTIPPLTYFDQGLSHHFDFSFNHFEGTLPNYDPLNGVPVVATLDFSHNDFIGNIPVSYGSIPGLETLRVQNNHLSGDLSDIKSSSIARLAIDNNEFEFAASDLSKMDRLVSFSGRNNLIFGSMQLSGLSSLEYMDLSQNRLNEPLDLRDIAASFAGPLRYLSVRDNPLIPPLKSLPSDIALSRSNSHQPLNFSTTTCFDFVFQSGHSILFDYDDSLFGYLQCNCSTDYFGIAPDRCYLAPSGAGFFCDGPLLEIPKSYFIYPSTSKLVGGAIDSDGGSSCHGPIGIEACTIGSLGELSNCVGSSTTFDSSFSFSGVSQCSVGSYGRMCANCACGSDGVLDKCYFSRGPTCVACSRVWNSGQFAALAVSLGAIAFMILTAIMYLVLSGRRDNHRKRWKELHVVKRFMHRVRHLAGLGLVSILIGFGQVYVEVTNYDVYALRAYLQLVNGELEGVGLVCLVPSMRSLLGRLVGRLVLPIVVLVFATCSVYTADVIYRLSCPRCFGSDVKEEQEEHSGSGDVIDGFVGLSENDDPIHPINSNMTSSSDVDYDEAQRLVTIERSLESPWKFDENLELLSSVGEKVRMRYPASGLAFNVGLSVVRFFYFNVALASTEYFFTFVQKCSGTLFIQSHPGVLYDETRSLRMVSIPFLVIYVGGSPLALGMLLWKLNRHLSHPRFEMYLGSLVGRYRNSRGWWELVLLVRKLSLALVLRGFPISNSLYSGLIQLVLCSHLVLQLLFKPWKQRLHNITEVIGAVLIILSQTAAQSGIEKRSYSGPWQFSLLGVVALFVVAQVVLIIIETVKSKTDYQMDWEREHGISVPDERESPSSNPLKED